MAHCHVGGRSGGRGEGGSSKIAPILPGAKKGGQIRLLSRPAGDAWLRKAIFRFREGPAVRGTLFCQWPPKMTPAGRVSSAGEPASNRRRGLQRACGKSHIFRVGTDL